MSDNNNNNSQQQPAVPTHAQPMGTASVEQLQLQIQLQQLQLQQLQLQQQQQQQQQNLIEQLTSRNAQLRDTLSERTTAIAALQADKTAETTKLQAAITTLRADKEVETIKLQAEMAAAIAALQADKTAETTKLQAAITTLRADKEVETIKLQAEMAAETTKLQAAITTLQADKTAAVAALQEERTAETIKLQAEKAAAIAALQAEKAAIDKKLQDALAQLNATKCSLVEYLDRRLPHWRSTELDGFVKQPRQSDSVQRSGPSSTASSTSLRSGIQRMSTSDLSARPAALQSSSLSSPVQPPPKRTRTSKESPSILFSQDRPIKFALRSADEPDVSVNANFYLENAEALTAVTVHLREWTNFDESVTKATAKLIGTGGRSVSCEVANRFERSLEWTSFHNEAHLAGFFSQLLVDTIETTEIDNHCFEVIPEFNISNWRPDLVIRKHQAHHVVVEVKSPKSVDSRMLGDNSISLLGLIRKQETRRVAYFADGQQLPPITIQTNTADICRASSCLLQLLGYIDAFQVNSGILATGQHSWFVRRDTSATNGLSFFVSKSVLGHAGPPVTLRRALFYTLNEFALKPGADAPEPTDGLPPPAPGPAPGPTTGPAPGPAPGQADAPPASGSASGSASEPSRRDGWAAYNDCAVSIHQFDAQLCPCSSGGKTLVSYDSGVNLMHSHKLILRLHGVIGRGRTGTVCVGCLDGERVAVKQVVLPVFNNTSYHAIRKEILLYDECKDLWGDAIPDIKEAILSRHHAFLVMELGQPCMAWGDQDRRLAEQALNKLHAHRILHRDLHSGNVVFVGEGDERKARIVDLESARFEHGRDFEELAAKEKARVARFGTPTEYDRRHDE